MPELPEVETVKNTLKKQILGKKVKSVKILYDGIIETNKDEFKKNIIGQSFINIERRGKFLIFELNDYYLVSHLRMEGKYFIKPVDEDVLRLTVLMLGGGPAIRGITQRVFHKHSVDVVIEEIVNRAKPAVSQLGCSPCTLAIGIGRSQFEATSLMMEAMVKGDFGIQSDFEKRITDKVNEANVGSLGLGGKHSVLATFAKIGPQRASGVRIVALRPCCCFEPRRASVVL